MSESDQNNIKRSNQRRFLDKFVDFPANFLIKHGFTPNILSFCGFFCTIVVAVLLSMGGLHFPYPIAWIVPFILFWAGAFDVFDGEVARRTENISKSGAFLDSNLDRLSDAMLVLGLIRARAENEGIDMKGVGFMERAERLIVLFFAFILEFWIFILSNLVYGTPFTLFFPIFTSIFTGLLVLTVIQRLLFSFKSLRKIETLDKN